MAKEGKGTRAKEKEKEAKEKGCMGLGSTMGLQEFGGWSSGALTTGIGRTTAHGVTEQEIGHTDHAVRVSPAPRHGWTEAVATRKP